MRHFYLVIILIFLLSGIPVQGIEHRSLGSDDSLGQYISGAWENDLYYQHDYYYTNGFQIDFFHDKLRQSPINRILIPIRNPKAGITWSGLRLRQEIFTPRDLAMDTISVGDHPYSSTLKLAQKSVFVLPNKQLRIVSGLRLGVLGPAFLGFKTQELAHLVSNPSRPPQGWEPCIPTWKVPSPLNCTEISWSSIPRSLPPVSSWPNPTAGWGLFTNTGFSHGNTI